MKISTVLLSNLENLVTDIISFAYPPSHYLPLFFAKNPVFGRRDRFFISETIFTLLRCLNSFSYLADNEKYLVKRLTLLSVNAVLKQFSLIQFNTNQLTKEMFEWLIKPDIDLINLLFDADKAWFTALEKFSFEQLPENFQHNLPSWIIDKLKAQYTDTTIQSLGWSFSQPASLDLRVNLHQLSLKQGLSILKDEGIVAETGFYSPCAIKIKKRIALQQLSIYETGAFEVQDEGSQLLAYLVAPRRNEIIIDFCAGAGGKALALASLMRNSGQIFAMDTSADRLAKLLPRMHRNKITNIRPMLIHSENDPKIMRLAGKANRVLVDAPCSGLGTIRRHPHLKWQLTSKLINEYADKQKQILKSAARLVKMNGLLIYATCSILQDENENIVNNFLESNSAFKLLNAKEILASQKICIPNINHLFSPNLIDDLQKNALILMPFIHKTDGFFAVVMRKII